MWVGESEKNIKGIFDDYKQKVKQSVKAPILLFNEADAIIGKRHSQQPKPSKTTRTLHQHIPNTHIHLALRANPFPEVTDLICRLPLSTLFY